MSKSSNLNIEERHHLNGRILSFLRLAHWTPWMGAQLLGCIQPNSEIEYLPTTSHRSLLHPEKPAEPNEVDDAKTILKRWVEDYTYDDDAEHESLQKRQELALCARPTPLDFLIWCEENFECRPRSMRPGWLAYWLSFIESTNEQRQPPFPAPVELVTRAVELMHVAAYLHRLPQLATIEKPPPLAQPNADYVRRMVQTINQCNGKLSIDQLIVEALKSVTKPTSPMVIWQKLFAMAKSREYPHQIRLNKDEDGFQIPHGTERWNDYRISSIQQYLLRMRRKAGLGKPTR